MDKEQLDRLYSRTRAALEEIKAVSGTDAGRGKIDNLERLLNELLGRISEQSDELEHRKSRDENKTEIFQLIAAMDLGKSDPFGNALGPTPVPGAEKYTASIYYYWWLFLRFSPSYRECVLNKGTGPLAKLYQDFGDIYSTDFEPWWRNVGEALFAYKYQTDAGISVIKRGTIQRFTVDRIAISVPLNGDAELLAAEVKSTLVKALRDYKRKHPQLAPKYEPKKRFTLDALHNKAEIYKAIEYDFSGQGHLEIYKQIRRQLAIPSDAHPDEIQKRKFMSAEYGAARILIRNVILGRFPDFTNDRNSN